MELSLPNRSLANVFTHSRPRKGVTGRGRWLLRLQSMVHSSACKP
jgi:hypothetical protein